MSRESAHSWPWLAVDASDRGLDRAVGHLAVRHQVPRSVKLIDVLASREDVDLDCLQASVGLRHRGDADHDAGLDVVERRLDDGANRGVGLELEFQVGPFTRFDHQEVAVDLLDRAAHARRRLRPGSHDRERGDNGRDGQNP